jgi:hypothetical protein
MFGGGGDHLAPEFQSALMDAAGFFCGLYRVGVDGFMDQCHCPVSAPMVAWLWVQSHCRMPGSPR